MRFTTIPTLKQFAIAATLFAATEAVADTTAFKCTAENGDVSYLDTKPSTGCMKVEVVRVNVGKGTAGDAAADDAGKTEEQTNKEIAERQEKMKAECENLRKNLQILKTKTFVQVKDEEGKVHTLKADEQQQRIKDTEGQIASFCS